MFFKAQNRVDQLFQTIFGCISRSIYCCNLCYRSSFCTFWNVGIEKINFVTSNINYIQIFFLDFNEEPDQVSLSTIFIGLWLKSSLRYSFITSASILLFLQFLFSYYFISIHQVAFAIAGSVYSSLVGAEG